MYRKHNLWEDTLRVAKVHGGVNASKQIAYAWAVHLENEQGSAAKLAMLKKMGLIEYAIDYAIESGDFEHAFQLADQSGNATKVPDIHLKHAMFLEDEGQFADAQAAFLRADKPKEAIEMYMHQQLWAEALQVAEANDAGQVVTVYRTHAGVLATQGKLAEAEAVYLQVRPAQRGVDRAKLLIVVHVAIAAYKSRVRTSPASRACCGLHPTSGV